MMMAVAPVYLQVISPGRIMQLWPPIGGDDAGDIKASIAAATAAGEPSNRTVPAGVSTTPENSGSISTDAGACWAAEFIGDFAVFMPPEHPYAAVSVGVSMNVVESLPRMMPAMKMPATNRAMAGKFILTIIAEHPRIAEIDHAAAPACSGGFGARLVISPMRPERSASIGPSTSG